MINKKITLNEKIFLILFIILSIILLTFSFFKNTGIIKINFKNISDFDFFYFEGKNILNNNFIYDTEYYKNIFENKENINLKPLYPPIIYYFLLPFSFFSYKLGLVIFILFNFFLYIFSIFLIIKIFKRFNNIKFKILFFSLLYPPFIYTIINCNISIVWIFIIVTSYYFAKKDKMFTSGLILSLFLLKPSFYIIIFIILLLSFRKRLFSGLMMGSVLLILITAVWKKFQFWFGWFYTSFEILNKIFDKDIMLFIKQNYPGAYFYPMNSNNVIFIYIEYIFIMIGLMSIMTPVIYSFNHTKNFSRNSFWFIFSLTLVLASPYLFNNELIILLLPLAIFLNLMMADRVLIKYIIIILTSFLLLMILLFILSNFIYVQLVAIIFYFFLINAMLGKRIKNYMPKTFIEYWDDYK